MADYLKEFSTRETPQREPIPGRTDQVENYAGGFVFQVTPRQQFERFLVLGSEGGTYYVSQRELTKDNAVNAINYIAKNGIEAVEIINEFSLRGRAPKQGPILFALALAASAKDRATRKAALDALPRIARTGSHLFEFVGYVQNFRGWGRSLREAVAKWYTDKDPEALAYQIIKYQSRYNWTHADVLNKAHPRPPDIQTDDIFSFIIEGTRRDLPQIITDTLAINEAEDEKTVLKIIKGNKSITWEMIPTKWLASPKVWKQLLPQLPLTALIRNLGRMTANQAIKPLSDEIGIVVKNLGDQKYLQKARVHPIQVLAALTTYASGHGARGSLSWEPIPQISDALDKAFYMTFDNVIPTNKNILIGLDVSGSMGWGNVAGIPGLCPREAAAAMCLVTASVEPMYHIMAFAETFRKINISPGMRLDKVVNTIKHTRMGGTDCALPMIWATQNKVDNVDAFIIYTDNETWYGNMHPNQALVNYRQKFGRASKLIVVGMTSTGFTIADPNDAGMLDVVGFDSAAPSIMADFIRG